MNGGQAYTTLIYSCEWGLHHACESRTPQFIWIARYDSLIWRWFSCPYSYWLGQQLSSVLATIFFCIAADVEMPYSYMPLIFRKKIWRGLFDTFHLPVCLGATRLGWLCMPLYRVSCIIHQVIGNQKVDSVPVSSLFCFMLSALLFWASFEVAFHCTRHS
jgi:hypothetical protein